MIIKNNFFSVIFLGNFNPAILTNSFLKSTKIFESESEPSATNTTPIFRNIDFLNIRFLIDLERFQVIESDIDEFQTNKSLDIAYKYINLLKYTPLKVSGINFNFDAKITDFIPQLEVIEKNEISKILNGLYLSFNIRKEFEGVLLSYSGYDLRVKIGEDKQMRLGVTKIGKDLFRINYNYEVRDLDKKEDNKFFIKNNFGNIFSDFKNITNTLFEK